MLTMRTFGNTMKELTVCHQLALDDKMEKFVDIFMDESYIVMVYEKFESSEFFKIIQVRCAETLRLLQTIRVKPSMFVIWYIHYSNGLLIFGSSMFDFSDDKSQQLKYKLNFNIIFFELWGIFILTLLESLMLNRESASHNSGQVANLVNSSEFFPVIKFYALIYSF